MHECEISNNQTCFKCVPLHIGEVSQDKLGSFYKKTHYCTDIFYVFNLDISNMHIRLFKTFLGNCPIKIWQMIFGGPVAQVVEDCMEAVGSNPREQIYY